MIKKKIAAWALEALRQHVEKHGAEYIADLTEWLKTLLARLDDQLFAAPPPPPGCEEECGHLLAQLGELRADDE